MRQEPSHRDPLPIITFSDQAGKDKKGKGTALLILGGPLEDAL
jgi:hypothetical protein